MTTVPLRSCCSLAGNKHTVHYSHELIRSDQAVAEEVTLPIQLPAHVELGGQETHAVPGPAGN